MVRHMMFLLFIAWSLVCAEIKAPAKTDSLRFAVIGDTGTGSKAAIQLAAQLTKAREIFPFEFVIMTGDNLYGGESPRDYEKKFERPYRALLDANVKFYASLGNHDESNQRFYKHFNMNGKRFYTFKPRNGVRFLALDSNYMDREQIEWLQKELAGSGSEWKICFFHHPLYSLGDRHGPSLNLRAILEPILVEHGVSMVVTGHEHFYERIKPQRGIYYFIVGSSAKLRSGDIQKTSEISAKGYDRDLAFTLMVIDGELLHFQTITRTGVPVYSRTLRRLAPGK